MDGKPPVVTTLGQYYSKTLAAVFGGGATGQEGIVFSGRPFLGFGNQPSPFELIGYEPDYQKGGWLVTFTDHDTGAVETRSVPFDQQLYIYP